MAFNEISSESSGSSSSGTMQRPLSIFCNFCSLFSLLLPFSIFLLLTFIPLCVSCWIYYSDPFTILAFPLLSLLLYFYDFIFTILFCFIVILLLYCYFIVILYEFSLRFLRYLVFKAEVAELREAAMAAAGMTNQQEINNTNNNNTNNNSNHLTTYTNYHKHEEKEKEKEKEREWTLDPLAPALAAFAKIREKTKKVVRDPADKPRKMCSKLLRDRYASLPSSLRLFYTFQPSSYPITRIHLCPPRPACVGPFRLIFFSLLRSTSTLPSPLFLSLLLSLLQTRKRDVPRVP